MNQVLQQTNHHALTKCTNYVKDLYVTMLCFVLQHESEMTNLQIKRLQELMEAFKHQDVVLRFQKRGLEVSAEFLVEVEQNFSQEGISYTFLLDAFVLSTESGHIQEEKLQLLTDLLEVLHLTQEEYQFLLSFSKMISSGKTTEYQTICAHKPSSIQARMFLQYFSPNELEALNEVEYYWLNQKILKNKDDFGVLKRAFEEISNHYKKAFTKLYQTDFENFEQHAPLAIFVLLMNEELHPFYIKDKKIKDKLVNIYNHNQALLKPYMVHHSRELYDYINNTGSLFTTINIEPEERKCLVIYFDHGPNQFGEGKYTASIGGLGGIMDYRNSKPLTPEHVNGEFHLFHGMRCDSGAPGDVPMISYMIDPTV